MLFLEFIICPQILNDSVLMIAYCMHFIIWAWQLILSDMTDASIIQDRPGGETRNTRYSFMWCTEFHTSMPTDWSKFEAYSCSALGPPLCEAAACIIFKHIFSHEFFLADLSNFLRLVSNEYLLPTLSLSWSLYVCLLSLTFIFLLSVGIKSLYKHLVYMNNPVDYVLICEYSKIEFSEIHLFSDFSIFFGGGTPFVMFLHDLLGVFFPKQ